MNLVELEQDTDITIQCHDNPDADTIASGFGLYTYFLSKGKNVRLIYSGHLRIHKTNLKLMIEELQIPIAYVEPSKKSIDGVLITVDCQYGAGNVTRFPAENVVIIDHHQLENDIVQNVIVNANLGSCSTLVWTLLTKNGYPVNENIELATALYYGLYADTNQFAELFNPLDMDMRDNLVIDKAKITLFRNANLTLEELEIAGNALKHTNYNQKYRYAIVKSKPCDPNILGLISDFMIQVDGVDSCIVYNEQQDSYKLSIRSCVKEIKASELAEYLTRGVGSGGGRFEKAGGFIRYRLYEKRYSDLESDVYLGERIEDYLKSFDIIYAQEYDADILEMVRYRKKKIPLGFVKIGKLLPENTVVTIRTVEGDRDITVKKDRYVVIGNKGEVSVMDRQTFDSVYQTTERKFNPDTEYSPTIKEHEGMLSMELMPYVKSCITRKDIFIYAKAIQKPLKLYTEKMGDVYMSGCQGDYIVIDEMDKHDMSIIMKAVFDTQYEIVDNT